MVSRGEQRFIFKAKRMEDEENKDLTPGGDNSNEDPGGDAGDGKQTDPGAAPTEIEIDGQKYTPTRSRKHSRSRMITVILFRSLLRNHKH